MSPHARPPLPNSALFLFGSRAAIFARRGGNSRCQEPFSSKSESAQTRARAAACFGGHSPLAAPPFCRSFYCNRKTQWTGDGDTSSRSKTMASPEKVAFITGANKGIGLETARGLGKLGIAVVMGSRDEGKGKAAVETLRSEGIKKVEAVRFDVTRAADHREIARHLEARYGKLDILVNNAGVALEPGDFAAPGGFNTTSTVTPEILRQTFETNFFAAVALTQALLPLIRKAPAGRIVNLSSILGSLTLHADPSSGLYNLN